MAYMDVPPQGAGNGQTAVLMHGKNFDSSYWKGPIQVLTSAGYRVIVPDQIGFVNKSSKPDINYTFDLLAANTAKLLDALKVEKVVILGHSTCGMLAIRFARTYPQRVTYLILEDPIGLEDYRLKIPPQTTQRLFEDEMNMTTEEYSAYVHHYFVTWKPEYQIFVDLRTRMALSGEFPRWAKTSALIFQMIYQQPVRYEYSLLKPPTLLIVGQQDRTVILPQYVSPDVLKTMGHFPQLAEAAVREIPHGKLVVVPNAGHVPHLEQPNTFNQAVLNFLKK